MGLELAYLHQHLKSSNQIYSQQNKNAEARHMLVSINDLVTLYLFFCFLNKKILLLLLILLLFLLIFPSHPVSSFFFSRTTNFGGGLS